MAPVTKKGDRFEDVDCGVFSVIRTSENALLLERPDDEDVWIPKSQLKGEELTEDSEAGDSGSLILPRWLAEKEGLC